MYSDTRRDLFRHFLKKFAWNKSENIKTNICQHCQLIEKNFVHLLRRNTTKNSQRNCPTLGIIIFMREDLDGKNKNIPTVSTIINSKLFLYSPYILFQFSAVSSIGQPSSNASFPNSCASS